MTSLEKIIAAGRELPEHQPETEAIEAIRTSILTSVSQGSQKRPSSRALPFAVAGVALAAAAALALWTGLRSEDSQATVQDVHRASVSAAPDAQFEHRRVVAENGESADEVVRLSSGRVRVAVEKLRPSERFRVIAGDAEVEVRGTAFDVVVKNDKLLSVSVTEGLVEVRPRGSALLLLAAGERWTAARGKVAANVAEPTPPSQDILATAVDEEPSANGIAPQPRAPELLTKGSPSSAAVKPRAVAAVVTERSGGVGSRPAARPALEDKEKTAREPAVQEPAEISPETLPAINGSQIDAGTLAPAPTPVEATEGERSYTSGYKALRGGNYGEAIGHFDDALSAEPRGSMASDARFWRAVALARSGKKGASEKALREFLQRHRRSARAGDAAVMLGWMLVGEDKRLEAARWFRLGKKVGSARVRKSADAGLKAVAKEL